MHDVRPNRAILSRLTLIKGKGRHMSADAGRAAASRITERDMTIWKIGRKFHHCEDGAVTVDWVVLTASVVSLVLVAMAGLRGNMTSIGQKTGDWLSSQTINTTF
jgi:hypothetical protein